MAYTSGTTADPKGVVHSHRTITAEIRQLGAMQAGRALPALVGAPVGHGIGMLAALLLPVWKREGIHLIDVWDPAKVLAAAVEGNVGIGSGATYFLTSLLDHPDFDPAVHLAYMSHVGLGGSAVPAAVTERATELGISIVRSFGSTEHPSITGSTHEVPLEKRLYTDGAPLPGVELRLVDADGNDVEVGEPGEIISRGPDCFVGYTDPGDAGRVRRRRLVPDRRHRRARRRRVPRDHRPQEGRHHSRRREHHRGRGGGAAATRARRRRVRRRRRPRRAARRARGRVRAPPSGRRAAPS